MQNFVVVCETFLLLSAFDNTSDSKLLSYTRFFIAQVLSREKKNIGPALVHFLSDCEEQKQKNVSDF
jgi:hypothetical protein